MKTFRQVIEEDEINESLVGKGYAVGQNRQHQTLKAQAVSKLNLIQNDCRRAAQEDDPKKQYEILFKVIFELAASMKLYAEMSSRTNNISTTAVLDAENIQKVIQVALSKLLKK